MKLAEIHDNKIHLERLLSCRSNLVPFIGAGFSRPACPTWADFLELNFKATLNDFLLALNSMLSFCNAKKL